MVTIREQELKMVCNELTKKNMISMDDLNELFISISKVLMEIERITESRNNWKRKYYGLLKNMEINLKIENSNIDSEIKFKELKE